MTVPAEELVVVRVVDGVADTSVLHEPAPVLSSPGQPGYSRFADKKWPNAWTAICGTDGLVYRRAGVLADVPACADCEAAA